MCFEKEEDAKKLKSVSMFDMKGMPVSVVKEKVLKRVLFSGKCRYVLTFVSLSQYIIISYIFFICLQANVSQDQKKSPQK